MWRDRYGNGKRYTGSAVNRAEYNSRSFWARQCEETAAGRHFLLSAASLGALGDEHNLAEPAIRLGNETGHVET